MKKSKNEQKNNFVLSLQVGAAIFASSVALVLSGCQNSETKTVVMETELDESYKLGLSKDVLEEVQDKANYFNIDWEKENQKIDTADFFELIGATDLNENVTKIGEIDALMGRVFKEDVAGALNRYYKYEAQNKQNETGTEVEPKEISADDIKITISDDESKISILVNGEEVFTNGEKSGKIKISDDIETIIRSWLDLKYRVPEQIHKNDFKREDMYKLVKQYIDQIVELCGIDFEIEDNVLKKGRECEINEYWYQIPEYREIEDEKRREALEDSDEERE